MPENILIKPSIQKCFDSFIQRGRVLFISAPCGFGKTVLADALLADRSVLRMSVGSPDFSLAALPENWDILLLDDFQLMQEDADQDTLCELIRSKPDKRFVLLSRGIPPGYLMAFQYAGLMTVLEADDLLFDREDIRKLFADSEVPVTDSELSGILKASIGHPLGVAITVRCMSGGKPFGPDIVSKAFREVFAYFETVVYRRFDLPVRRFLLELAPFESFDTEMARMVSGDPHAGELLDWLRRNTTMLRYDGVQRFRFWPEFRAFLLWEMEQEYTPDKQKALFSRGGMYYELKEDYVHALECYSKGGDHKPKAMSSFTDIPADSYYAKAVAWAVENGITTGTGDGKFSPDATCTRAQAVTFLFRTSKASAAGAPAFSDVAANAYYAEAVKWAMDNGITNGIGGNLFGSNNDCTRAQIVTFLWRLYTGE